MKMMFISIGLGLVLGVIIILCIFYVREIIAFMAEHYLATWIIASICSIRFVLWRFDVEFPDWRAQERIDLFIRKVKSWKK